MPSATLAADVVMLGRQAARVFRLTRRKLLVMVKEPRAGTREDGCCWRRGAVGSKFPMIELRVHRSHRPRQPLKRSTVMAALAHELAHLKIDAHNAQHGELTRKIAGWLREQGQPVSHVLHSNTGSVFLPAHKKSQRARSRTFRRAWQRPAARS